jgi:hypothetical protein
MKTKVKLSVVINDEVVESLKKVNFDFSNQNPGFYEDVVINWGSNTLTVSKADFNKMLAFPNKEVEGEFNKE